LVQDLLDVVLRGVVQAPDQQLLKEQEMLVVTGRIAVKADEMAVLLTAASEMVVATLAEEGCSRYQFSVDIDETLVLHLFEEWKSSEALDLHFSTLHFATLSDALLSAADGPSEFNRYEIASVGPLFG
jgi:quinol monooxygenase YgiN